MSLDVVTFGEAMMMLVADRPGPLEHAESFIKRTAGAETNVAIGLAEDGMTMLCVTHEMGFARSAPACSSRGAWKAAATRRWSTTARAPRRA